MPIYISYTDWHSGFRAIRKFRTRSAAKMYIKILQSAGITDAHILED